MFKERMEDLDDFMHQVSLSLSLSLSLSMEDLDDFMHQVSLCLSVSLSRARALSLSPPLSLPFSLSLSSFAG